MTREEPRYQLGYEMEGLDALTRAIRAEDDGKQLRRDLAKGMRQALGPAADRAKAGIRSMPTGSSAIGNSGGPALRSAIAKRIRPEVKLGGRWTGARLKARKTPAIRGFRNAPKRTQAPQGWRTQTFGGTWRVQHGKRNWFDNAVKPSASQARAAVLEAMESMAARIASRSRQGRR